MRGTIKANYFPTRSQRKQHHVLLTDYTRSHKIMQILPKNLEAERQFEDPLWGKLEAPPENWGNWGDWGLSRALASCSLRNLSSCSLEFLSASSLRCLWRVASCSLRNLLPYGSFLVLLSPNSCSFCSAWASKTPISRNFFRIDMYMSSFWVLTPT